MLSLLGKTRQNYAVTLNFAGLEFLIVNLESLPYDRFVSQVCIFGVASKWMNFKQQISDNEAIIVKFFADCFWCISRDMTQECDIEPKKLWLVVALEDSGVTKIG